MGLRANPQQKKNPRAPAKRRNSLKTLSVHNAGRRPLHNQNKMKRLLDQWERKNSKVKSESKTVDDWERGLENDEVMRDASPPPAPPQQPVVSDDSEPLPAPLLPGQVEALETVGICMLVEYMLAPPGAEEPQQLRAFWPDASAATPVRTPRLFLVDGVFMRPHRRDAVEAAVSRRRPCHTGTRPKH